MPPSLSVVMPVHDAGPYLAASIESVLGQTFTDFELVILDDGSTDDSRECLRGWARRDARIRLIESAQRGGAAAAGNRVVREARAEVCARMDADDIAHPDRLRAQWDVFRNRPEAAILGTLWEGIDAAGQRVRPRDRWLLMRPAPWPAVSVPFPHGSIMFRRSFFARLGGYRTRCVFWEDLDLYLRMAALGPILVLPDVLYSYRFHETSTRARGETPFFSGSERMMDCLELFRSGADYSELLMHAYSDARLRPQTLAGLGLLRLWAGQRPGIHSHLRRMRLFPLDRAVLRVLLLAIWGELAPRSLRLVRRAVVRMRDALVSPWVRSGEAVPWRLGRR
ncbi:MAG TPA: glycosyltransferase family A protein [Acidobacteriota bacterium]